MYQIIFVSSAAAMLDSKDLDLIANYKQQQSKELGVTGLLLYKGGNFLGVFEGEESAVKGCYLYACNNGLFRDAEVINEGSIEERAFEYWSMNILNSSVTTLFNDVQLRRDKNGSMSMLNDFIKNMR